MRAAILVVAVIACRSTPIADSGDDGLIARRQPAPAINPHLGTPEGCLADTTRTERATAGTSSPARPIFVGAGPLFPRGLRDRGTQGEVIVCFVVSEAGRAEASHLIVAREAHPELTESVRVFLRSARFDPATISGGPVRSWVKQTFQFQLAPPGSPPRRFEYDLRPPPGELIDSVYLVRFVDAVASAFRPGRQYSTRPVELEFTVSDGRTISDIKVRVSSGVLPFDEAAVRALRTAALPSRPRESRNRPVHFTLSVGFVQP